MGQLNKDSRFYAKGTWFVWILDASELHHNPLQLSTLKPKTPQPRTTSNQDLQSTQHTVHFGTRATWASRSGLVWPTYIVPDGPLNPQTLT